MKIMIKLMLLGLIGLLVAPLIIKGPDGRPIMSLDNLNLFNSQKSAYNQSNDKSSLTTVYKWQDAEGQWHFSDNKIKGENHQTLRYNSNSNVIQSLAKKEEPQVYAANNHQPLEFINRATSSRTKPSKEEEEAPFNQRYYHDQGANSSGGYAATNFATIPTADIPELMKKAKEVQQLIDARNRQLEDTLR